MMQFWDQVAVAGPDECWNWTMAPHSSGYGQTYQYGKKARAHRVAYILGVGKIPDGMHVLHKCDNRMCCNPGHLYLGLDRQNVDDKMSRGRQSHPTGEKCGKHKLTEKEALLIRDDNRKAREIAKQFKVNVTTVYRVKSGVRWAHLGESKWQRTEQQK